MKNTEVYITSQELELAITKLAKQINEDYLGEEVTLICILKGSFMFFADLIRKLNINIRTQFIITSSYGSNAISSGSVTLIEVTLKEEYIKGKNIIIIEDIVDTGHTYSMLMHRIKKYNPKTLKFATLLFKPSRLKTDIKLDYVCFEIEDKFIVGYGLDLDEQYRELPYIGFIK